MSYDDGAACEFLSCHRDDEHEPAVAFTRAYIRTVNTYLDGDCKADQQVVADYEEPVPAEQVINRSFVGEAVGIPRD